MPNEEIREYEVPNTIKKTPNKIMPSGDRKAHKVVALIYDGLCTFEFGIAAEIFGLKRPEIKEPWYEFSSVAFEKGPLWAGGGLKVLATGTIDDFEKANTIIIPGWRGKDAPIPAPIISAVKNAYERGARIISICSGAYILAAAGLLRGCSATTHWRYVHDFANKFPEIKLEHDSLYVDNGAIVTSAGSSAGIDMCLHIVRQDFGEKIANSVAKRLVMHAHRQGGQTQFIEQVIPVDQEGHRFSATLDHIKNNIGSEHSISTLACYCGMSERTFQRKFRQFTGITAGKWITNERLNRARLLLEETRYSVETIAENVGMPNVGALRYHFRNSYGVSPGEFRKRFARISEC